MDAGGSIDGNGTARVRQRGGSCSYDFVWQKIIDASSREHRFQSTLPSREAHSLTRVDPVTNKLGDVTVAPVRRKEAQ
jgi:hypothetical protein